MREILFRGKHPKAGWVYGAYIRHETRQLCVCDDKLAPEEIAHYIARDGFADWNMPRNIELIQVDSETVGQYTGISDKNGERIFEGDILRLSDGANPANDDFPEPVAQVIWDDGGWNLKEPVCSCDDMLVAVTAADYKVIGNIHDNPELMEAVT